MQLSKNLQISITTTINSKLTPSLGRLRATGRVSQENSVVASFVWLFYSFLWLYQRKRNTSKPLKKPMLFRTWIHLQLLPNPCVEKPVLHLELEIAIHPTWCEEHRRWCWSKNVCINKNFSNTSYFVSFLRHTVGGKMTVTHCWELENKATGCLWR